MIRSTRREHRARARTTARARNGPVRIAKYFSLPSDQIPDIINLVATGTTFSTGIRIRNLRRTKI